MPSPDSFWNKQYAGPRYLFVWLAFAWLRLIVLLPLRWQLALGRFAGRLTRRLIPSRRRIVEQNLGACFPEESAAALEQLGLRHFEALGMSVFEMAMGWYGSLEAIDKHVRIDGVENLEKALSLGSGVILYSVHFTSFEIFFPKLAQFCPRLSGMYKNQRNPLMNKIMTAGRGRSVDYLVPKEGLRDMIRELSRNAVFWYASDQSYGGKSSALIPFFGVPAMTNTAISRIARSTGATVLPYFCRRIDTDGPQYIATIGAPLKDFPTDDAAEDTQRLMHEFEKFIAQCPEQYWWIHQRFKGRPDKLPDIYAKRSSRE